FTGGNITLGQHMSYFTSPEVLQCPTHTFLANRPMWNYTAPPAVVGGQQLRNSYAYVNLRLFGNGYGWGKEAYPIWDRSWNLGNPELDVFPRFYRQNAVRPSDWPVFVDGFISGTSDFPNRYPGAGYDPSAPAPADPAR